MYELYYNNSLNIIMVAFRFLKYNICVQDDIRNVTSSQNTSSALYNTEDGSGINCATAFSMQSCAESAYQPYADEYH